MPLPVDSGCFAALRSATRAPAASPLHWLFPPPVMLSSQTLTWLAPPADRSLLRCHLITEAFSDPLSKTAPQTLSSLSALFYSLPLTFYICSGLVLYCLSVPLDCKCHKNRSCFCSLWNLQCLEQPRLIGGAWKYLLHK